MSVIFVVLPLAVLFSVLAVAVFFWAVSHGQFDDLTTPAVRVLQDDAPQTPRLSQNRTRPKPPH
ncbi:MAG TPA: cbb3-type cytochrome oxidase assembly protein CcoS [Polyangiaceae bacterium]